MTTHSDSSATDAHIEIAPAERRPSVDEELRRLAVAVAARCTDPGGLASARVPDRQGIGGPATVHRDLPGPEPVRSATGPGDRDHRGA